LNTQTGNVSPQFHCIFDDSFETCKRDAKFQSLWQSKAKLQSAPFRFNSPDVKRDDYITTKLYQQFTDTTLPSPTVVPFGEPLQEPFNVEHDDHEPLTTQTDGNDDASYNNESNNTPQPSEANNPIQELLRETIHVTRSGRQIRPPSRFDETQHSVLSCVVSFLHTFSPASPSFHVEVYLLQPDIESNLEPHPFALLVEHVQAIRS